MVKIEQLRPGQRTVKLSHPSYLPISQEVELQAGQVVYLKPQFVPKPNNLAFYSQQALLWSGVAAAVAGAVVLGLSFQLSGSDRGVHCFEGCEGGQLKSYGPIPKAALGYSLIGMGATWSLGTWIFSDHDHIPWIEGIVGLVIGGTALGVSAALSNSTLPAQMP